MEVPKLIHEKVALGPSVRIENRQRPLDIQEAEAGLKRFLELLTPGEEAVFVRVPIIDPSCPKTSDLDLLVFGQVAELIPQRLRLPIDEHTTLMADVIWLPFSTLDHPEVFTTNGVIPHRLLNSRVVFDRTGYATRQREAVRRLIYRTDIQQRRIAGFLDLGFYAVREIGVTWDFPGLALFWLHMAYVACLAALCDGMHILCPNIYTRPFDWLRQVEERYPVQLERSFIRCLHLETDPLALIPPLRRIHQCVSSHFPEPAWPPSMRSATRSEYRYFLDQDELEWRIGVAEELVASKDPAAATYYLRFWSYALCRGPMVYRCAQESRDVSFMRPERAVRSALEADCPEILDDLSSILSGCPPVTVKDVKSSLEMVLEFRELTLGILETCGVKLGGLREWQPFDPAPHDPQEARRKPMND
jgi:hypothetical protein